MDSAAAATPNFSSRLVSAAGDFCLPDDDYVSPAIIEPLIEGIKVEQHYHLVYTMTKPPTKKKQKGSKDVGEKSKSSKISKSQLARLGAANQMNEYLQTDHNHEMVALGVLTTEQRTISVEAWAEYQQGAT